MPDLTGSFAVQPTFWIVVLLLTAAVVYVARTQPPRRKTLHLSIPDQTVYILNTLCVITGLSGKQKFAKIIDHSVRTYCWILRQQAFGRTIVALETGDIAVLKPAIHEGEKRPALERMVAPGMDEYATTFFGVDHVLSKFDGSKTEAS